MTAVYGGIEARREGGTYPGLCPPKFSWNITLRASGARNVIGLHDRRYFYSFNFSQRSCETEKHLENICKQHLCTMRRSYYRKGSAYIEKNRWVPPASFLGN